VRIGVRDLLVKRKERDGGIESFARLGSETNDFETCHVDLFTELIHGDVGWRADEHLAWVHLGQVVNDRG
jgi:hypothetical protein